MQMLSALSEESKAKKWLLKMCSTRIIASFFYQVYANEKEKKKKEQNTRLLNIKVKFSKQTS